jgi:hypothetical protein
MSVPSLKPPYRVVVIEWHSHTAVIEAESRQHAEAEARRLWAQNAESEIFCFEDSGIDRVIVEEML